MNESVTTEHLIKDSCVMERNNQAEIGPASPLAGTHAEQDTEKFVEATEDQGPIDSRRSSPTKGFRQAMYREFAGVRLGSDRDASPGIGQSSDPLPVQRRDRGNPFGPNAQARSDTPVQSGQSFPTFPAQVKVEKVHKGNFASWKVRIKAAAIQGKCIRAFEENRSGFDEDSVAYNLLFSSTPETWHVT